MPDPVWGAIVRLQVMRGTDASGASPGLYEPVATRFAVDGEASRAFVGSVANSENHEQMRKVAALSGRYFFAKKSVAGRSRMACGARPQPVEAMSLVNNSAKTSFGLGHPRIRRGRSLSSSATAWR